MDGMAPLDMNGEGMMQHEWHGEAPFSPPGRGGGGGWPPGGPPHQGPPPWQGNPGDGNGGPRFDRWSPGGPGPMEDREQQPYERAGAGGPAPGPPMARGGSGGWAPRVWEQQGPGGPPPVRYQREGSWGPPPGGRPFAEAARSPAPRSPGPAGGAMQFGGRGDSPGAHLATLPRDAGLQQPRQQPMAPGQGEAVQAASAAAGAAAVRRQMEVLPALSEALVGPEVHKACLLALEGAAAEQQQREGSQPPGGRAAAAAGSKQAGSAMQAARQEAKQAYLATQLPGAEAPSGSLSENAEAHSRALQRCTQALQALAALPNNTASAAGGFFLLPSQLLELTAAVKRSSEKSK